MPAVSDPTGAEIPDELTCPRCGERVSERFYGPCTRCREQLVASMTLAARGGGAGNVAPAVYVPKSNVVANHVATKD